MTVIAANGTEEVAIPRPMCRQRSMSNAQAIEIEKLSKTLETQMGWSVDIECAYHGEKLYLLQCRPISMMLSISFECYNGFEILWQIDKKLIIEL